ncbi:MAG TPA: chromosome segregation protein SMC, partial [Candidatus Limnocylindria bacterium]|nr:chromosome segregation protein SMC [Candidatus Limnocylindria bacterium]
ARDAARERWAETRGAAETMETRVADRRRERALAEARVAQLEAALPRRLAEREAQESERAALGEELRLAREADAAAQQAHADAEAARAARRGELLELERARGGAGSRLGELERTAQATAIEASRRDEALAGIGRERELALEGLPDSTTEVPAAEIDPLSDDELEAELRRVRRMLSQIGSVNPFAVEEHRELSERLTEMSTQESDLRGAIASTEELIARLDAEIAGQFDTAFRAIAERFDEFCQLLFAGGSGSLQMADEADGDAPGGIEIVVRPPGKRLQRLAMLSGGERALTGVALLFAMLTVNPVPFCILDEVDAALDEANIGRFADALRRLSESIDFVVITHNRATIEVADTIYGVTMTDAAVSRVLSLRLADLPAEVTA